jgi:hypothetical protein
MPHAPVGAKKGIYKLKKINHYKHGSSPELWLHI